MMRRSEKVIDYIRYTNQENVYAGRRNEKVKGSEDFLNK